MPSTARLLELQEADRIGSNPDQHNYVGSSTVDWQNGKPVITSTLNPEYQALADQRLAHVSQGPRELGQFQNGSLSDLFQAFGQRMANRGGMNMPVGGLDPKMPQAAPQMHTKPMPVDMQQGPTAPQQLPQQNAPYQPTELQGQGGIGGGDYFGYGNGLGQLQEWLDNMGRSRINYNYRR